MPRRASPVSRREIVRAVGSLEAGEPLRTVAQRLGIAQATLRKYRDTLVNARPDRFPNLVNQLHLNEILDSNRIEAGHAGDAADRLKSKMDVALEMTLDRLIEIAPSLTSGKDVAAIFAVLYDKRQVAAGKPTSIQGTSYDVPEDATPKQLEAVAEELRRRRLESGAPDVGSGKQHTQLVES